MKQSTRALNEGAQERMRVARDLGDDLHLEGERGVCSFADGDRVVFLQDDRSLGVKERHARERRTGQRAVHVGAHR